MQFLYNTFIHLYKTAFWVFSKFNTKAELGWNGRKNWEYNLKSHISGTDQWIWMHCSSLGEFEQGRPVFEALKIKHPNYKFALSFFSPSGYEIGKNYEKADYVFYLPFDTEKNAQKLSSILKPKFLILAKYDYWYNHLKFQKEIGTEIIVVSAIFRPNQIFFKPYGKWFINRLNRYLSHFFVQDNESKELLLNHKVEKVTVAGDTRFDRVKSIAESIIPLHWVEIFKNNFKLIVVGSSWKEDHDLWVKFINQTMPLDWKIIIVPHEINKDKINHIKAAIQSTSTLYSEIPLKKLKDSNNEVETLKNNKVLIVDTIGLLSKIYASADIAYVGGGFNKSGVHNTLEPAVFGIPVVIGPEYAKFREVKMLKKEGLLFPIETYEGFEKTITNLMSDSNLRATIDEKSYIFFQTQPNSTKIIMNYIESS